MPPRRTPRANAGKLTPRVSSSKSTAKSATKASPTTPPSSDISTANIIPSLEPVPSLSAPSTEITSPSDVNAAAATRTPETTPLTSPTTRKSSSKTPRKCSPKTASSKSSPAEASAIGSPETYSDLTKNVVPLPETSKEKIVEKNFKNNGESRDPIAQYETLAGQASENVAIEPSSPEDAGEIGQSTGFQTGRDGATTKTGTKIVVKKTVRVVKKVVKKRVAKRVQKGQAVSSNEESGKLEVDDEWETPNPSVLGAAQVRSLCTLNSMEVDNTKPEPNASVSLETRTPNFDIAVSARAENPNCDGGASIPMAVEHPNSNITCSIRTVNPEEPDQAAEGKKNCLYKENLSEVLVSDLVQDRNNESESEHVVFLAEPQAGDQNLGLGGKQKGTEFENVDSEGGDRKEGAKEEVENCVSSELKEEVGMGDGIVLSGELEALERRKRRKTEIFVGGLDKDAKEEDVRKVFQEVGDIVELRLVMNDKTGKNKGFAFVRYASAADAKKALERCAKVEICGKQCGVSPVEGNDTIFLGNIDKKWNSEDILKLLKEIGIEKIDKVTVMADPCNIESNRGFAFLELETSRDAQTAYRKLQKKDIFGKHHKIKVAWAQPLSEPDEEEMLKVKSVYAEYLPFEWNEEKVKDYFKRFGEIQNVVLARNLHTSRRKDFAFVNYTAREAALACIEAFNRERLNHEGSKVRVKVSLAKPMPKGKQAKHVPNPVIKEPPKKKPKPAQHVIKPHQPINKGIPLSSNYNDFQVTRASTTAELVHLLREQASWRQPEINLGIGSVHPDYPYSSSARKRPFSLLGDDPLHSDPGGYPRARFESSFPAANPSYNGLSQGVGMTSLPYHSRQGSDYASESLHGIRDYPNTFQTRGGASYNGSGGTNHRY